MYSKWRERLRHTLGFRLALWYAAVFVVSSRTGRLVLWDRPSFEAASPEAAEQILLGELEQRAAGYGLAVRVVVVVLVDGSRVRGAVAVNLPAAEGIVVR